MPDPKRALLDEVRASGISARVVSAVDHVPREEFVPLARRRAAYADRALPIGHGQTISQPSLVALMTDLLDIKPDDVVLEIGTGSGYQAAILSKLAEQVYSIEVVAPLAVEAAGRLRRLGYTNVEVIVGDGNDGLPARAPFDAICVTASAPAVPHALVAQLARGGRMVIPVGEELRLITKDASGELHDELVTDVTFVPLIRCQA